MMHSGDHGRAWRIAGRRMFAVPAAALLFSMILQRLYMWSMEAGHPWEPHQPSFNPLLPEFMRPYPSFEGWYTRIMDASQQFSAAVIMATNYATNESQVTLIFSIDGHSTVAHAVKMKNAKFDLKSEDNHPSSAELRGFQWEAPGVGRIRVNPHETHVEVNLHGHHLTIQLDHELPWDPNDVSRGPEGWVSNVPFFPCHWYVYSFASRGNYTFITENAESQQIISGTGYAHQEKNWGQIFPAGHVWLQGITENAESQLVFSGAYFKLPGDISTPFVFALGYRSLNHSLDFRSTDVGIIFKDVVVRTGSFSVTGIGPSHSIKISATAPASSFCEPIFAPVSKLKWSPACQESFAATIQTELYEHIAWGVASKPRLVEKHTFHNAAFEFGQDLVQFTS